jgi:RNA polymerase sigma-70 factor (ECF subfamily)
MSDQEAFGDFVRRIRAGDDQAAAELVRRYEPFIRRAVRLRLEDRRLARLFDSMDICQSVLASFFVRTAAGQYDLERPEQLIQLLVSMARHKLASAARREHRQCRDRRRATADAAAALGEVAASDPSPSQQVAGRDLLEQVRQRLRPDERALADLRAQGLAWAEIAGRLGGTAHARLMQHRRALQRVTRELGLDEDDHE